ncbi:MAG TPA: DUF4160 domain-containing protein [Thermoanaerobaculia bacterium]|nr:DUF4160 domain-containing protein [Thermoanaerobaculia bacterium]
MSPTVFREGPYRFAFFSLEEPRMHIHVFSADGEAKFWIEPAVEFADGQGITAHEIRALVKIVERHRDEIAAAWRTHFGS